MKEQIVRNVLLEPKKYTNIAQADLNTFKNALNVKLGYNISVNMCSVN